MNRRVWIVEDNVSTVRALREQYSGWECQFCVTFAQALAACGAANENGSVAHISDEDVVTVDSQLPITVDTAVDPSAGQKFIAELRMRGVTCRVFWHSALPLDQEFSRDLAVEAASPSGLGHLAADRPAIPAEVIRLAHHHRARLFHRRLEYFNSLCIALQVYLFVRDLDSAEAGITPASNLVLEELGPNVARELFLQHESAWSMLRERVANLRWWFRRPVRTALAAWRRGDRSLEAFDAEFRPSPRLEEIFRGGNLSQQRWLRYSPLCDRSALETDATAACLYHGALRELWQFCGLIQDATEQTDNPPNADWAYRAFQLIALLHYPFAKSRNLAERSVLSHQDLSTRLRILFQKPGVTETDGGSPARTEAVLTGTASPGVYPEIDEALQQWSITRRRMDGNILSIAAGIDPFCQFLEEIKKDFDWQWSAVGDLHSRCISRWLSTEAWADQALNALSQFDSGFDLVRRRELSISELITRYDRLREAYSGRDFFNFQQTT